MITPRGADRLEPCTGSEESERQRGKHQDNGSSAFVLVICPLISIIIIINIKILFLGFPGGAVVGNLPAGAGDTGSSPGLGGSHMPRSSWAREPRLLSLRVWSLCPATGGAAIVKGPRTTMKSGPRTAMKSGPHLPQLEKALTRKLRDPTQP